MSFVHLHVHTQYSILDGHSSIENLFSRAEELGMPGLAITDHGNMYGVKEFLKVAKKHPGVKPIVGCEVYVTRHFDHKLKKKGYYHLILLAKNYIGYKNLIKIVSTAHIDGFYYRPRISHEILEQYHEGLICSSACIAGEIPSNILAGDLEGASDAIEWHKKVFGEDYYLEVMLHKTEVPGLSPQLYEQQKTYCKAIFELAGKHQVKVIATNDIHFVRKEDGPAHDRLICLTTNAYLDDPSRLRYTQQEYMKSEEEMAALFPNHPEALSNTLEVLDKVELFEIDRGYVLPKFDLPEDFSAQIQVHLQQYAEVIDAGRNDGEGRDRGEDFRKSVAYLCYLTYKGAAKQYGSLNEELKERLDFELKTISRMGFPDYFLIVQDFINWAKDNGISVGPGRGSAAGSAVAYCLGITSLDPIRYDLLFERFLNPERISMPDIDVDFDDDGRYKVIKYVQDKYGEDHISHVITFGTMAAKSAIKDVARVSRLSIDESNRLARMIPDRAFTIRVNGEDKTLKPTLQNCLQYIPELKNEYENGPELIKEVIYYALQLEGCIRQTGIHACAMIIGRGNLTDYIPITLGTDKGTGQQVWVSQYEGNYIEDVGMLKMDFLGLKTLSIIMECLDNIRQTRGENIDIDHIPMDDPATYALYSRGDTKSVFQFESSGMKDWLQRLHPERFEDLIAMNALYRPGPMEYIPSFVARKRAEEKIDYDLPEMEEYLQETYGVTVYQEQVMRISQKVAGFSRGKADKLRKAMGKKNMDILQSLHDDFIDGGIAHGHPHEILDKIWRDWEKFASYAFNKSHATCYAWVSYQTGWLKAHYPPEFQAANLSQNLSNIAELTEIMDDCKKNGIKVLNPDINESSGHFTVNKDGNIRFGLGGIHGFGSNIVEAIVAERSGHGLFTDIFDFLERMGAVINKKNFETLLYAGTFDSFGYRRSQFNLPGKSGDLCIDELIRYSELFRHDSMKGAPSLFGEMEEMQPERPAIPEMTGEEDELALLQKEKELVGVYLSSHPLDRYRFEMNTFVSCSLNRLPDLISQCDREKKSMKVSVAGLVTDCKPLMTKSGRPFSKTVIEDYNGNYELTLFGEDHERFMNYMQKNTALFIEGEIEPRYRTGRDRSAAIPYTLKVKNMILLGNLTDSLLAGFSIDLNTPMLNDRFRKDLVSVIRKHKGNLPLSMHLYDPETEYKIPFYSRKFQVAVTSEFIQDLNGIGIDKFEAIRK